MVLVGQPEDRGPRRIWFSFWFCVFDWLEPFGVEVSAAFGSKDRDCPSRFVTLGPTNVRHGRRGSNLVPFLGGIVFFN